MGYDLGIDIGTSFTAAAVRGDDGIVRVVGLGPITDSIPTVLYLNEDGSMVAGDAANRRALLDAAGAAREFKRRLGDPTPLILRGSPFSAEALMSRVLRHVVERVVDRERGAPRRVVVTHPASWGRFRMEIFQQATVMAGLEGAELMSEPVAAAIAHAADRQIAEGAVFAVYDLGGGTFDSAVLRRTATGFELLGEPVGLEHVGGLDFDAAIVDYVQSSFSRAWSLDPDNPEHVTAMAHLRRACVQAKELLSIENVASIPVVLPGFDEVVTMQRAEFESRIAPLVSSSVASLDRALSLAKLERADLTSVLLVGGSSRVPLVRQMLAHNYGDLVVVSSDPVHTIARGASMAGDLLDTRSTPLASPLLPRSSSVADPPGLAPAPLGLPAALLTNDEQRRSVDEPRGASTPDRRSPSSPIAVDTPIVGIDSDAMIGSATSGSDVREGRNPWTIAAAAAALVVAMVASYALVRNGSTSADTSGPGLDSSAAALGDAPATEVAGREIERAGSAPAEGMVEIPAGTYPLGLDQPESNTSESLSQTIEMSSFFIDEVEVSNASYKEFIDQTGAEPPASWRRGTFPEDQADHPAEGVSYDWATAYCTAASKRLPTESEWEVAARGTDGRLWPWGDDVASVTLPTSLTYAVGTVPGNVSPFGVYDMAGNVWEWVSDSYDRRVDGDLRILRGGQNGFLRKTVTRLPVDPLHSSALQTAGFRCAADGVDASAQAGVFGDYDPPERSNKPVEVELADGVDYYDDFSDATSGWTEKAVEGEFRLGYHPNEYLHLETRSELKEALALGPWRANPDQQFDLRTSAFVEPSLTTDGGSFAFGIAFSFDDAGRGLVFLVDERSSTWTLASREPTGSGPYGEDGADYVIIEHGSRPIPADVTLEILHLDDDLYEVRINGAAMHSRTIPGYDGTGAGLVLISYAGSEKVHVHFDDFQVSDVE